MPIFIVLVLAAVAGALAPLYMRLFRRELTRGERIAAVAAELGLTFTQGDPAYPGNTALRLPFEIFSRGSEQTCENVMAGTLEGIPLEAFDFLYVQRTERRNGASTSEPERYSCAVATIGGDRPHVLIEPASDLARESSDVVRLEWGDFNARYRVRSAERGYATELLDVDVMAWLVDDAPRLGLTWELQRDRLLCRARGVEPDRFAALVRALVAFGRRIRRAGS